MEQIAEDTILVGLAKRPLEDLILVGHRDEVIGKKLGCR